MKRILWVWYPANEFSGGRNIINDFVISINKLFKEDVVHAYISNREFIEEGTYNDDELYNNSEYKKKLKFQKKNFPIATVKMVKNKRNIFIYPEDVKHQNPLNAKHIVNLTFYFDSYYNKKIDKNYYVFFNNTYHELFTKYNEYHNSMPKNFFPIYLFYQSNVKTILDKCKNLNKKRIGNCFTIRKGPISPMNHPINNKGLPKKEKYTFHPPNSYELTFEDCVLDNLIILFNKYKYFYTYDAFTFLIQIAMLCGCKTIVIPYHNKKDDHLKDALLSDYNHLAHYPICDNYKEIDFNIIKKNQKKYEIKLRKSLTIMANRNFNKVFFELIINIQNFFKKNESDLHIKSLLKDKYYNDIYNKPF